MQIEALDQLKPLLPLQFYKGIIAATKAGDPDWLLDMINELDYLKPGAKFYMKQFHARLHKLNLTSANFNIEAITKELLTIQNS